MAAGVQSEPAKVRKASGIEQPKHQALSRAGRIGRAVRDGRDRAKVAAALDRHNLQPFSEKHQQAVIFLVRQQAADITPRAIELLRRLVDGEGDCEKAPHAVRFSAACKVIELAGVQPETVGQGLGKSLNELSLPELQAFINGGASALDHLQTVATVDGESVEESPGHDASILTQQPEPSDQQSAASPPATSPAPRRRRPIE